MQGGLLKVVKSSIEYECLCVAGEGVGRVVEGGRDSGRKENERVT